MGEMGATSSSLCLELKIQGWEKKLKWQSPSPLGCPMTFGGGPMSLERGGSHVWCQWTCCGCPCGCGRKDDWRHVTGLQ